MNVQSLVSQKKMNDYFKSFLKVNERLTVWPCLKLIFETNCCWYCEKGFADIFVSRINDRLIPDFKTLVQVATHELVGHIKLKSGVDLCVLSVPA
ncbi:hypothetical protein P9112_007869 [Eukaryota sp. TZLM1-RC]